MIISNSEIALTSGKFSFKNSFVKESLRIINRDKISTTISGQKNSSINIKSEDEYIDAKLSYEDKLKILLISSLVKKLTGRDIIFPKFKVKANIEVEFYMPNLSEDNYSTGIGIIYNREESYYEKEEMVLKAIGFVETQDGKKIDINYDINLVREHAYYNRLEIRMGDRSVIDPIIINLDEGSLKFKNETYEFDLDIDGDKEKIPYFNSNFAYLALDINANGIIDDGKELFGPKTGHGFSELENYDEDKNGWIDEKDSIFNSLRLWMPARGDSFKLLQLKEKNIGAIYLNTVDSLFEISEDARSMGILKKAGFYLKETGGVGQVFEIDILV